VGVFEIVREALRIARAHKSLWLFGFLAVIGGGGGGGGGGGEQAGPVATTPPDLGAQLLLVGVVVLPAIVAFVILKYLSTAALIEGVKRARGNGSMTIGEGFREGWAHWGVLFRVGLLFILMTFGSVAVLSVPCVLVGRAFGSPAVFVAVGMAALVGVPWLLTLYMWQSFAERIAVLENRHALDAIRKARLFLHGRLHLGLKLVVAAFLCVLLVGALGALVIGPLVLLLRVTDALVAPVVVLGVLAVVPLVLVGFAFVGVSTSAVWTVGYLTQVEQ
jgi:hypothetical protein